MHSIDSEVLFLHMRGAWGLGSSLGSVVNALAVAGSAHIAILCGINALKNLNMPIGCTIKTNLYSPKRIIHAGCETEYDAASFMLTGQSNLRRGGL
ncbi:hypothetical protein [Methylomonas rosea]|uniref:Uncharacterized protein n=1 Tax=Methylomonas rosea TaxID=2952227 RepID=A0ABT1TPF0_9GAMM|nr:hypothetical protein [Methylomonas sp. WSC-7]MCQ8116654.1 hypothetical protein [Methylomonas sp. WSC-7]